MEKTENTKKQNKVEIFRFFSEVTGWIVAPALLALVLKKIFINNTIFLIVIPLSFLISFFGILKALKNYQKQTENNNADK